jgi:hypothetical protein
MEVMLALAPHRQNVADMVPTPLRDVTPSHTVAVFLLLGTQLTTVGQFFRQKALGNDLKNDQISNLEVMLALAPHRQNVDDMVPTTTLSMYWRDRQIEI